MKKVLVLLALAALLVGVFAVPAAAAKQQTLVNVVLTGDITPDALSQLGKLGKVKGTFPELDTVFMQVSAANLPKIRALPFVAAANPDQARNGAPIDTVAAEDFMDGLSTWDLDAINITTAPFSSARQVTQDGTGVYVAVLDTGLVDSWRQYFPEERIAEEYAISFGGGGGEVGHVSSQPNKWEHDQNSHGTHVTSTILGYQYGVNHINGVAPLAWVIPVKVLNQNGSGWSSVVARGITYVADLKAGPLADYPVVINMSLGGPVLDAMEKAAIDYAIEQGVIIVASAGNNGAAGMGYPGAYEPVISAAASGWLGEWTRSGWWYNIDDPEPTNPELFYITDFSSRELSGQDLDVAAPGSWVVGPYQLNSGQLSYYYLGGTSMAAPHVAGTVALMAEKNPVLTATEAESIIEAEAIPLLEGCLTVNTPYGTTAEYCWEADATGAGLLDAAAAIAATP